jgi:hypothetical protein
MKGHRATASFVGVLGLLSSPAMLGAQSASSVHVCVGVDHVLRSTSGNSCPAGQASYNLALDGTQPNPPDEDKTVSNEIGQLKKTIDFLKDRVSSLEKELAKQPDKNETSVGHIVHAPFHVVDKSGKPIFTVSDAVATEGIGRVRVGHGSGDNYGIWVTNAAGTAVAVISETKDGAGGLTAYTQEGKRSAQMHGGEGFTLFNNSNNSVASMGLNAGNKDRGLLQLSGLLQIFDGAGQTMVEAGTSTTRGVGVVRVGPGAKCVPMATLRLPDCIMGRAP